MPSTIHPRIAMGNVSSFFETAEESCAPLRISLAWRTASVASAADMGFSCIAFTRSTPVEICPWLSVNWSSLRATTAVDREPIARLITRKNSTAARSNAPTIQPSRTPAPISIKRSVTAQETTAARNAIAPPRGRRRDAKIERAGNEPWRSSRRASGRTHSKDWSGWTWAAPLGGRMIPRQIDPRERV